MKHLVLIIAFSLLSFSAVAQNSYNNLTATTPPESGRYEIITSSIAMRETYLLDKDTGDTWQLVSSYYGYSWQKLRKQEHPADTIPAGHKGSVYQITMSGIAVKGCYLVNTLTGATWTLYKDSDTEEIFWGLVQGPE